MSFDVAATAYDAFMGRYSGPLAPAFAAFARIDPRTTIRVLDVGAGPGALTGELVRRLGPSRVVAVEPSEPFAAANRQRHPGVDVRRASAEDLPFHDGIFDAALAQLVVHFMADPVAGLREMARVTRPGGVVAACVWDHAGGHGPVSAFWDVARRLDPVAHDEGRMAGARAGHLRELLGAAGLAGATETVLEAPVVHATFEDWWEPYAGGVGPAGAYVKGLDPARRDRLREACRAAMPPAPFRIEARAWAARGVVPAG